jgi:hypothetical protein
MCLLSMWAAQQYRWILYQSQLAAFTEVSAQFTEVRCAVAGSRTHNVQEVFESFRTPGDVGMQEQSSCQSRFKSRPLSTQRCPT